MKAEGEISEESSENLQEENAAGKSHAAKEVKKHDSVSPFNFQTVPMDQPEESVEEKLDRLLRNVEELLERTASYDDNHAMYEDMVNFYNSFDSKAKSLADKLDREVEYTRYIETQISSKSVEKECLMLKKALVEERALMGVKLDGIRAEIDKKIQQLENLSKVEIQKIVFNIEEISNKVAEFVSLDDKITASLEAYRKDMTKASKNEYNILQAQCRESIVGNNENLENKKKNVLSFLKSCEKQNGELIRKIPEQKHRFSWKDTLIYVMAFLCIVGMVLQILV